MLNSAFAYLVILEQSCQVPHVVGADVPFIGARVHRYAVRAGIERRHGTAHDVRKIQRPRVAQQRDLVDVYGKHEERPYMM